MTDIITELDKPGRDPRPEFKTATFKEGVHKVSDLTPGMILEGTVTNVAAFGAFVDVGVHQDGLVHVSAMSHKFVSDPHEVVRSGQVVKVKVMEVDVERQRIGLSLRLDDEPGQQAPKRRGDAQHAANSAARGEGKRSGHKSGRGSRGGSRGRTGGRGGSGGGGAMADALKKAGF